MVETKSSGLNIRDNSMVSLSAHTNKYLTTAMLLGSQNCTFLGQRLQKQQNRECNDNSISLVNHTRNTTNPVTGTTPTSLFTIDSILAPKTSTDSLDQRQSDSPCSSPSGSIPASSPMRPTRVPALLHPGLHLGHLAAAAASGFGSPTDFLGEWLNNSQYILKYKNV